MIGALLVNRSLATCVLRPISAVSHVCRHRFCRDANKNPLVLVKLKLGCFPRLEESRLDLVAHLRQQNVSEGQSATGHFGAAICRGCLAMRLPRSTAAPKLRTRRSYAELQSTD